MKKETNNEVLENVPRETMETEKPKQINMTKVLQTFGSMLEKLLENNYIGETEHEKIKEIYEQAKINHIKIMFK